MDDYKTKFEKQTELAFALIRTIADFRDDLTEVEIVGALQLVSWQRGMAMFGKSMLEEQDDD
jgi:hypothetical protein